MKQLSSKPSQKLRTFLPLQAREETSQKRVYPFFVMKANGDLGKPLQALPYLELAEKSLNKAESLTPCWHARLAISRGQAFYDAGEITTAVDVVSKGFIMVYQCHSPHQMNRVRKLLRKLENGPSRNHPRAQDLKTFSMKLICAWITAQCKQRRSLVCQIKRQASSSP